MRPIGSLNHKHEPPGLVECVYLSDSAYVAREVVEGLADDSSDRPKPSRPHFRVIQGGNSGNPLTGLIRVVREAIPDARNIKLNWAAYHAGEHVANGSVARDEAESELLAAALSVGLGEREAERTIRSGLDAAERTVA
jgi:hypothetical protein